MATALEENLTPLIYSKRSYKGSASCCQRFTFSWVYPITERAGNKEHLSIDDFGGIRDSSRVKASEAIITREYERYGRKGLIKPMAIWFGKEYMIIMLVNIVYCCLDYVSPYLVFKIIKWIESEDQDMKNGLKYLVVLIVT